MTKQLRQIFINLTKSPLNLFDTDHELMATILPESEEGYGLEDELPSQEENLFYVVSPEVKLANADRNDLLIVGSQGFRNDLEIAYIAAA